LHENCPHHGRLNADSETIDGFGFGTRPAVHVWRVESDEESITIMFCGTTCAMPTRNG
jgi:hypothetical protein